MNEKMDAAKNRKDVTGQIFNRFTVISYFGKNRHRNATWLCHCECGNERVVLGKDLRSGNSKSCGCIQRGEGDDFYKPMSLSDPDYPSVEARIFTSMRQRCNKPTNPNYRNYGGRGIQLRFKDVFDLIRAIGRRPSPEYTVERIDNDGHYEAGNVKWATRAEQARNTRMVRYLTVKGVKRSLCEWAEVSGVSRSSIGGRLARGWCGTCTVTLSVGGRCGHRRNDG